MSAVISRHRSKGRRSKTLRWSAASVVLLLASIVLSVGLGAVSIPLDHVWGILCSKLLLCEAGSSWSAAERNIVWELRMPRALLAAAGGASLAAIGTVLQVVTRNP
jgi:iron complex transport system permease protein